MMTAVEIYYVMYCNVLLILNPFTDIFSFDILEELEEMNQGIEGLTKRSTGEDAATGLRTGKKKSSPKVIQLLFKLLFGGVAVYYLALHGLHWLKPDLCGVLFAEGMVGYVDCLVLHLLPLPFLGAGALILTITFLIEYSFSTFYYEGIDALNGLGAHAIGEDYVPL